MYKVLFVHCNGIQINKGVGGGGGGGGGGMGVY